MFRICVFIIDSAGRSKGVIIPNSVATTMCCFAAMDTGILETGTPAGLSSVIPPPIALIIISHILAAGGEVVGGENNKIDFLIA